MIILLHSSKTMRRLAANEMRQAAGTVARQPAASIARQPMLLERACRLDGYLKTLSAAQLGRVMSLSPSLAEKTRALIAAWTAAPEAQSLALDCFAGDIYSGLHANDLSPADRDYADKALFILSGLYGIIRPYDGICPYRLEMGYKLPDPEFANLYAFWGSAIADCLPAEGLIVNLAADEYAQVVTRFITPDRVVSPKFLTASPKTGKPEFVVVHAKIARGAFARWLITSRTNDAAALEQFDSLGYRFMNELSTISSPTFVCDSFGGKGLSIRLV